MRDEDAHRLLNEAAARLVYVDGNLDSVDLERAIQDIEEAHAKARLARRDSLTEEIQDAVEEHGRDE